LVTGVAAIGLLAGCSPSGGIAPGPAPTSSAPHLSQQARAAIAAAQAQAAAANATTAPTAVASDTIQTWPALDHGPRTDASGPATEQSAGVYSYTVQSDDVASVIALRFGLCDVDIVDPASTTGVIHPGDVLTVERRMSQPGVNEDESDHEHEGWKCNWSG
jgi:hypothetical protein